MRYWDDFDDVYRTIRNLALDDVWPLQLDGKRHSLSFTWAAAPYRPLLKHWVVTALSRSLDVDTVKLYVQGLASLAGTLGRSFDLLEAAVISTPAQFRAIWLSQIYPTITGGEAPAVRSFLRCLCDLAVGHWLPDYASLLPTLPARPIDLYRAVRTGDCFVPMDQQARLIGYLDDLTESVRVSAPNINAPTLRDACILIISYQYAFRAGQIARIRRQDVYTYETGAVHVRVRIAKQWRSSQRIQVNRAIRREWCPIFVEYIQRSFAEGCHTPGVPPDSFFCLTPEALGFSIRRFTEEITGEAWSATDLRHTAAQRQVDTGSSRIGLAEFMGHSTLRSGDVYYDTSPTQAKQVNDALAVSPIYSQVAEIARTRTIDLNALLALPDDQQIGGAPHGIPIAGIGGCGAGQSNCQKNPILSCYECRHFMPLNDPVIHRSVVSDLRQVVLDFVEVGRGQADAPAFAQLRRTLEAAQAVSASLEGNASASSEQPHE